MADFIKVLGQSAPSATTETDLYEVPNLRVATCSSLVVTERGGAGATFRVSVAVDGGTTATKDYLYYDKAISANDTFSAVLGMTLNQGDVVRVYASTANLSFNLFGVETE